MPSDLPLERLQDIITNIDRVHAHSKDVKAGAELDDKTRDAVERCLERISEAAKKLGPIPREIELHKVRDTPDEMIAGRPVCGGREGSH